MRPSIRLLGLGLTISIIALPTALAVNYQSKTSRFPVCGESAQLPVCRVENVALPPLKDGASAWLEDGLLYIAYRGKAREVRLAGEVIPEQLPQVGDETWLRVLRIQEPDKASLRVALFIKTDDGPPKVEELTVAGKDVILPKRIRPNVARQTFTIESKFLPSPRRVEVWLSPNYKPGVAAKTIYLADGVMRLATRLIEHTDALALPPFIIVGIAPCDTPAEPGQLPCRAREYVGAPRDRGGDPDRFLAHDRFFTQEVIAKIERDFGLPSIAENRAVAGASSGGDWAGQMALLHPELFSYSMIMSPGMGLWAKPAARRPVPRVSIVSGIFEPDVGKMAKCWANSLAQAGASVTLTTQPFGHSEYMWEAAFFADAAAWLKGQLPPATKGLEHGSACPQSGSAAGK